MALHIVCGKCRLTGTFTFAIVLGVVTEDITNTVLVRTCAARFDLLGSIVFVRAMRCLADA